ncbi:MAG: protein-L-isoaspartate(D-aspartate) O-methyltransferase [Pseudomonadota bacterium]|nr:protein-L-isoaspartate(D-aspartate) O-methyltransferase [Pseudomonadota bacterium]
MSDFTTLRERMVDRQIAARGLDDPKLLAAFRAVPREDFISGDYADYAYQDSPLPIESGQTISQPYIVALTIDAAGIKQGDKVLEVGAGSGYAAAVIGRIASDVIAIERHRELVELAQKRMSRLGYSNVKIVEGDGTLGWPEEAPYDAIVAAASGSHVPQSWIAQLRPGGRIVMPIGEPHAVQSLIKVTKDEDGTLHREDLGGVRFVPLIGKEGFRDGGSEALVRSLPQMIAEAAEPLPDIEDPGFAALFDRYADARVVLLGEASHGTSEFYRARAAISRRLIERHGFTIVALEADWPDAATLDRIVRHREWREGEEKAFARFPTWMWRNREFDSFVRWLHGRNEARAESEMAGLFGLDLYNMHGSMRAVIDYLEEVDPKLADEARERYACLDPFSRNPATYGRMATSSGYAFCKDDAVAMLQDLMTKRLELAASDGEEWLDAAANARLVKNAEAYYRVMYEGSEESWNLRDTHMFETLCALLEARGPDSKAIVWAHNSHIGDARFTEMGMVRGELNIGQLAKERFGDQAHCIGFGTHSGTVAAADDWDSPMRVKAVQPSLSESYERLSHDSGEPRFLLDLREGENRRVADLLEEPHLERFIGVIYRPETERWSHYSQAILPHQFDGWVWFDESEAVTPLPGETRPGEQASADETWPFGL